MAIEYTVKQLRATTYDCKAGGGAGQSVKYTLKVPYLVTVKDDADPDFNPSKVVEGMVQSAVGLPYVNKTTYYDEITDTVGYGLLCTSKTVKRTNENGLVFKVEATYTSVSSDGKKSTESPQEEPFGSPSVSLSDLPTTVTAAITSEDVVLYKDLGTTVEDPRNCRMMKGVREMFNAPVVEQQPRLTLTVTQYEPAISFQTMMDRSYKVNTAGWNSKNARQWKIGAVTAVEQEVRLAAGPVTCAKVTYPITLSDYVVRNLGAPADLEIYHDTGLPLISHFYIAGSGEKTQFADADTALGNVGLISPDGYVITGNAGSPDDPEQNGQPDYERFYSCKEIPFTFLKYGNP
jgi:hypothetical protein